MGILSSLGAKLKSFHLNYCMITSLYMMEPWEKIIINTIVVLVLSMMLYSSWIYLPHYTYKLLFLLGIFTPTGQDVNLLKESEDMMYDSGMRSNPT